MDGKGRQQPAGSRPGGAPRRPSPAVYRRRRLVAGVLALLILVGLGFAVAAGVRAFSGGKQAASAESTVPVPMLTTPAAAPAGEAPAPGKEQKTGAAAEETPGSLCPAESVRVAAATDAEVYPAGATPVLTLTVTNAGETACEINVGTSQMEFLVTSGSDRIFSSVDCQDGAKDLVKKVEPGASETANFPWNRNRSAPGCAAVASNPNPGYYIFTARLGESSSEKAVFQLE
ncbi:hypothetical protein MUK71_00560 [Arthrobacter zhangbolii]|uniref:DUF4232 domain-containing protein n=1 Tax=Arthrobacter zhangbolii TaxID=2886936 RepID=A0A9X1MA58_9MICC|nr:MULTISPECIES: hypothetical protein [Arthrobacter]MCC3274148.1 hypothetical protein [Arthrobacter zhangbolii]MCC3294596.1 hypothetical protein [Arthrobacter zhangbolii]MDN3902982.1 hypothetical protein [Arthrobacter sp. YD2]UON92194.1 hypothetical protein MUK71_00560 [Arthrobacter zhangbolii]